MSSATSPAAFPETKRVALVIGNGAYVNVAALDNPVSDAMLISDTLRKAGFEVIIETDLDKATMTGLLDQFTEAAFGADIAVIFYAGHGIQVEGRNYLFPINAKLENVAQHKTRTISVDVLLAAMPADPVVGIIILDACRDNPLARTLAASRSSVGAGLAPVQASGVSQGSGGILIEYATDPGSVAYDGKGNHSPYTTALARHLVTPGLETQSALTRVRAEVSEVTRGIQRPWHNASLAREVFIGGDTTVTQSVAETLVVGEEHATSAPSDQVEWTVEQKVWDEASKWNTPHHYEYYLQQYPEGRFAGIARLNIDQLARAESAKMQALQRSTDAQPDIADTQHSEMSTLATRERASRPADKVHQEIPDLSSSGLTSASKAFPSHTAAAKPQTATEVTLEPNTHPVQTQETDAPSAGSPVQGANL